MADNNLSGYFDYAAATPVDSRVLKAMRPFFAEGFYNPSAQYSPAREVKQALDQSRFDIAQLLGCRPAEIIFTAGGTEANNMAVYGVLEQYRDVNVVISAIEHESIRRIADKYSHKECPVNPSGIVEIDKLVKLIDDKTVMVSIMLANNEIGSIQPLRKISQEIARLRADRKKRGIKLPIYLHTDAAQAANYLDLHVHRLGVDMMSLNGGKIYGPKQSGLLYVRGGVKLEPLISGGGQERGLRSGTENIAGIVGLSEALKNAVQIQAQENVRLKKLQSLFISEIKTKIPTAEINGSLKNRLSNNVHISLEGQDNERLLILLDEKGICAATGSACSASHEEASHVLKALGMDDEEIHSSLRFTMGRYTSAKDVKNTVACLASLLA